jgi:hypothetical protein
MLWRRIVCCCRIVMVGRGEDGRSVLRNLGNTIVQSIRSFSYSQCFQWNQPIEMDFGYQLGHLSLRVGALLTPLPYLYTLFRAIPFMVTCLTISVHTANTVQATWKHIRFSLYVQPSVHYMYYLAEYMFGALRHALPFDPFTVFMHTIRCVTGGSAMCTVSTSSQRLLCSPLPEWHHLAFICTENFPAVVDEYYNRPK